MNKISREIYRDKLKAAFLARAAGCTLGAPVEGWTSERMRKYALDTGMTFPPSDYWLSSPDAEVERFGCEVFGNYTKSRISRIPCDDDVGYTLLSLFIAEEAADYPRLTLDDVAAAWLKYITICYTAEEIALANLKNGVPPHLAAEVNNPYDEWIGADIRCDGYAYMNPANPEIAASLAETDALISHRNNGVYGARFFAAAISAAFRLSEVHASLLCGLQNIPADSSLYDGISWALSYWGKIESYAQAHCLVDERYPGMSAVHTVNNACLTIFALSLGGNDAGKVISNAVAMAHDCDCTAATAGSICGAAYGMSCLDGRWYLPFGDGIGSYFNGAGEYSISEILSRFEHKAEAYLI